LMAPTTCLALPLISSMFNIFFSSFYEPLNKTGPHHQP
jgi:hypothetical protein